MSKVTAIIPVRGGSKGIPGKNMLLINGYPLLYYVLTTCIRSLTIDDIVVITDSENIKDYVNNVWGSVSIIDEPANLALDTNVSEDVLYYAIEKLDLEGIVVFAQATSPLTGTEELDELVSKVRNEGYDSSAFYTEDYGFFFDINDLASVRIPRQYRPPLKREAGNAWCFTVDGFLDNKTRLFGEIGLVKIDAEIATDVDTYTDVKLVSLLLNERKLKNNNNVVYIDIDGTLCTTVKNAKYQDAVCDFDLVNKINRLYENNTIILWTARGATTGINHEELTKKQLDKWGVKYDDLRFGKPHYDLYIDDKSLVPISLRSI